LLTKLSWGEFAEEHPDSWMNGRKELGHRHSAHHVIRWDPEDLEKKKKGKKERKERKERKKGKKERKGHLNRFFPDLVVNQPTASQQPSKVKKFTDIIYYLSKISEVQFFLLPKQRSQHVLLFQGHVFSLKQ